MEQRAVTTITELSAQAGRPTITELPVNLGFEPPTERQFKALMRMVQAAHAPTQKPRMPIASSGMRSQPSAICGADLRRTRRDISAPMSTT
jgi:hypothetical protein